MDWMQMNYDVIWTGCWAEGVDCIEAGANGGRDLDAPACGSSIVTTGYGDLNNGGNLQTEYTA